MGNGQRTMGKGQWVSVSGKKSKKEKIGSMHTQLVR
jgi:hypothetical protein